MIIVKWGTYEFSEDGKPLPIKKWKTKKFGEWGGEEEAILFEAYLYFRKKNMDLGVDVVIMTSDKAPIL